MTKKGHQNFWEMKWKNYRGISNFRERNKKGNLSVEMCSEEFFLERALLARTKRLPWNTLRWRCGLSHADLVLNSGEIVCSTTSIKPISELSCIDWTVYDCYYVCSMQTWDWLIRWIEWDIDRSTDLIYWLIDWLTWLTDRFIDWLIGWLIDWLTDRLIYWLTDWLTDWLIDWLIDWLCGLLTGHDWFLCAFSIWVRSSFHALCIFHLGQVSVSLQLRSEGPVEEPTSGRPD